MSFREALHEIHHWPDIYKRRWELGIQYETIQDFLPRTSSTDFRVRFHNFVFPLSFTLYGD